MDSSQCLGLEVITSAQFRVSFGRDQQWSFCSGQFGLQDDLSFEIAEGPSSVATVGQGV